MSIFQRFFFISVVAISCSAIAQSSFAQSETNELQVSDTQQNLTIEDIKVQGLLRVSEARVLNQLPVGINDQFGSNVASQSIRSLYSTGLFEQVDIAFESNTMVIKVVENSSVVSIEFEGNEAFDEETLTQILRENGIAEGEIYQPLIGDKLIKELQRQYLNEGKYAADVSLELEEVDASRVGLKLIIEEGETAKIEKITIVGNEFFSDKEILGDLQSKAGESWNPFSRANRYSRSKVSADIQEITNKYTDEGFADFQVTSTRVSINPEKDAVFLSISVQEGPRYTVKQFSLNGRLTADESEILPLVAIRPQEFYSRSDVQKTVTDISAYLADKGFSNARVVPVPSFDVSEKTVSFAINVNPAKTVFVRRIDFVGNDKTSDEVIRREMTQFEGASLSTSKVQQSIRSIRRLRFISAVDIQTVPVANDDNQVDLVVAITEGSSAAVTFGAGVSDEDGLILQAAYNESNFLGTGKAIDFLLDTRDSERELSLNYTAPYVTKSGVSRTIGLNWNQVDTEDDDTSEYIQNTLGVNLGYTFPLGSDLYFDLGGTAERIDLESTDGTAPENLTFIEEHPESDVFRLNSRLSYDTRDSLIAPSEGWYNYANLEIAVPGSDLEYYRVGLSSDYYIPLTENFTFKLSGLYNYGDGMGDTESLPFFKNYFAGGTSTVRGFQSSSLGPRDTSEDEDPLGGAKRLVFNATLLTPIPGADPDFGRLGFFVDAGQVFSSDQSVDFSSLRKSMGVSLNIITPLGPLAISYAVPIDEQEGDETDEIQFSIGRFLD